MTRIKKFFSFFSNPIRKFFALLLLGLLGLFGFDTTPKLRVYFVNRDLLRKNASLVTLGNGKYEKAQEVDFIIKNGKNKRVTRPAIVVADMGRIGVRIVVDGEKITRLVDRSKIKAVSVIRKSKSA